MAGSLYGIPSSTTELGHILLCTIIEHVIHLNTKHIGKKTILFAHDADPIPQIPIVKMSGPNAL